jgi:hypothetical protein
MHQDIQGVGNAADGCTDPAIQYNREIYIKLELDAEAEKRIDADYKSNHGSRPYLWNREKI